MWLAKCAKISGLSVTFKAKLTTLCVHYTFLENLRGTSDTPDTWLHCLLWDDRVLLLIVSPSHSRAHIFQILGVSLLSY